MDLSVSIVSHNSHDDLVKLMPSLTQGLKNLRSEILLVDNRSNDDSVRFISENYPEVKLTRNIQRKGYGTNHNQNLKKAKGRYVLFMNADMVILPGSMDILFNFMDEHQDVGICCPNILNQDGTLQYLNKRYPSVIDLFLRRFIPFSLKGVFKNRRHYYEMRDTGYDTTVDVPFISGCFMFCKTSVIRNVQGFDERYFLYFEDVDLCRKVQTTARTVGCPQAKVVHRWERMAHKEIKWLIVFIHSAIRYFNKWGISIY